MLEAYIYGGLRTPFGRHSGALARVRPDDLLAGVIKEVVARSGFAVESIDDVSVGCASQAGEDSRNIARHALLLAGPSHRYAWRRAQPPVRLGPQRPCRRGPRHHVRRGGRVHHRRRREHDARAVRGRQSRSGVLQEFHRVRLIARRALPQSEDREPVRRRHHARDRRQPGARSPALARGMRPVRTRLAAEICRRRQGRLLPERDPSGLDPPGPEQAGPRPWPTTSIRAPRRRWTRCSSSNRCSRKA